MANQSEQINELATALAKCQGELTFAAKSSENPFHKSKYADLSSVWESIREPLTKNGLSVVQCLETNGEQVILVSTLMHTSGQWIRSSLPVLNANKTSQGQGSGITYCRRYALAALVGCVQDDDDAESAMPKDRTENIKKEAKKDVKKEEGPSPLIDSEKRKVLYSLSKHCDPAYIEKIHSYLKTLNIIGLENVTEKVYPKVFKGMTENAEITVRG